MVAFDGKEPVGVLIGCKRPPHTLVHRIAVHPGQLRKGHGRHLLTSLSAKLAILGPPNLVAEIPAGNSAARALFAACGWREERTYTDFILDAHPASPAPGGVVSVTLDDLIDIALPADDAPRSWERTRGTLLKRTDRLLGLAIASGERIEASLLYTRNDANTGASIWNLHVAPGADTNGALGVLVRDLAHRAPGRLAIPRIHETEVSSDSLRSLGFKPGPVTMCYTSQTQSRA
jgi:GNAT superfamily N-acetyltransferase